MTQQEMKRRVVERGKNWEDPEERFGVPIYNPYPFQVAGDPIDQERAQELHGQNREGLRINDALFGRIEINDGGEER